ncbi:MAG TPA: response regulator [Janthinobacterium sp.]|nr:response regulator [Janthinobacterium sp.]
MEQRILIYAPTGQDGALTAKVLSMAAIASHVCRCAGELGRQLGLGAGGVVTVEEALPSGGFKALAEYVACQPGWSDLPIILLTHRGTDSLSVHHAVSSLGNLTLLERPVHTLTLITSVHAILRARSKQYLVREAERRKDEFLASLGHELRNPLAPIKTSVSLLSHLYPDSAPVGKIRDVVERQVTHLTRLVDDLLDVARITSGKIELRRDDIRFSAVIGHVGELCAQPAANKRIHIDFDLPQQDAVLHADYARVVQILANILSNAVKFTPFGGHIEVHAWVDAGQLCVSIKDSGIGLDAEEIPRIFTMFEQSKTVTGHISSGLGIGLSLSRQFAEMHGGSVDAYSDGPGLGSEFLIRLPLLELRQDGAAAPAVQAQAQACAAKCSHVLVVDDNRDAADSLKALFQMDGYDVATAYDGYAALAALEKQMPELIVMDLGMPGMDGYEAARLIRERADAQRILMIALTGWGQTDARSRTLDAGFDHHLIKPVDFNDIIGLVNARFGAGAST